MVLVCAYATHESVEGLNVKGQSPRWWGCVAVAFSSTRMRLLLRERERQITPAVVAVAVAVAVAVVVVVIVDGIDDNGCIASASVPEVHILPGQGRQRCASCGSGVFPRGWRRRRSNPTVVE